MLGSGLGTTLLYAMTEISLLHKEIIELFKKYKYNWDTSSLPMNELHEWSDGVSQLLSIDKKTISSKMSELFWALSSVQLSLGYTLIARQTCQYPKGIKIEAYNEKDIPVLGISEIHLFYHLNNAWESIYRCWERLSAVLCVLLYPDEEKKLYFNDVINRISADPTFTENPKLKLLQSQIKYWNKVAKERNKISHFESSPIKKIQYESSLAKIYGSKNQFIPKISFSSANLLNEINKVKESYYRIFPAIISVKDFIENYINKKLNLKMNL